MRSVSPTFIGCRLPLADARIVGSIARDGDRRFVRVEADD